MICQMDGSTVTVLVTDWFSKCQKWQRRSWPYVKPLPQFSRNEANVIHTLSEYFHHVSLRPDDAWSFASLPNACEETLIFMFHTHSILKLYMKTDRVGYKYRYSVCSFFSPSFVRYIVQKGWLIDLSHWLQIMLITLMLKDLSVFTNHTPVSGMEGSPFWGMSQCMQMTG